MKKLLIICLLCGCSSQSPIERALTKPNTKVTVLSAFPATSQTADSLELEILKNKANHFNSLAIDLLYTGESDFKRRVNDSLTYYDTRFWQQKARVKSIVAKPGFVLCRYVLTLKTDIEYHTDTLTAVIDPSFNVTWPR